MYDFKEGDTIYHLDPRTNTIDPITVIKINYYPPPSPLTTTIRISEKAYDLVRIDDCFRKLEDAKLAILYKEKLRIKSQLEEICLELAGLEAKAEVLRKHLKDLN